MSYKLVIAEKPSVAQSIAKVIGADKREDGYLEGNGYIVSWCVGHLVELASPESYDEKYEKWRYEDLPILPSEWNYQIAEATRKQFGILKKLIEREDVTGLVEATDAGREGELIFRLVYDQAKCKKPFERLWISSMEDQAISDGFSHLKNGREYDDLYRAALCRERADWIVGMNATRLFSTLYGQTLNVGRVMTPTLAMIVQREAEIDGFKPEPIYRLSISCGAFRDAEFMNEIEGMITELVRTYKIIEDAEALMHPVLEEIGTCPCCGRHVVERQKGYSCENRQCNFVLWKQNRFFEALGKKMTKPVAIKLLSDGKVALKGCKSKKTGKTYDTTVIMTVDLCSNRTG